MKLLISTSAVTRKPGKKEFVPSLMNSSRIREANRKRVAEKMAHTKSAHSTDKILARLRSQKAELAKQVKALNEKIAQRIAKLDSK